MNGDQYFKVSDNSKTTLLAYGSIISMQLQCNRYSLWWNQTSQVVIL